LSNFFAYVSNQFGKKIKAIQCDNGREFDSSSTQIFLLSNGTQLRISCPYTSPQNGKAKHIIRSINNVIRTLLIQTSLPECYWAKGLHTAAYLLNRLPTKAIQVACPHIVLFGSAPSYEHLRVFGCACYPNTAAIAPHKLAPPCTRYVFLGYSFDHKGYCYLDLSTNRMIVSRHMVFDEDRFPLAASPNPTDLDFLCESGSTVSTVGTQLTTVGTMAPCQPSPEVPPRFKPLVAPLPALAIRPGFLPRAAPTVAPRAARLLLLCHARPRPLLLHRLRSRTACHPVSGWPHPSPMSVVHGSPPPRVPLHHPPLQPPPAGGQGVVVPITPPKNPHRMVTQAKDGFRVPPD
jgi:hypothetical protein